MNEEKKEMVDLTGHWFVNFGTKMDRIEIEGSRIVTLTGLYDPDTFLDILTKSITDSLPEAARKILEESSQRIVIRTFNRIDQQFIIGGTKT